MQGYKLKHIMERHVYETIIKGDTNTFLKLIEDKENEANILNQTILGSSNSILHVAARLGHVGLVEEVVKRRPEMVFVVNDKEETPLHEACREGKVEVVKVLVEVDAGVVYKVNFEFQSCLFVACERGQFGVVKFLLDNFHALLMLEVDHGSTTSLHVAGLGGFTEIVKELIQIKPDMAWKKDQNGCTALHLSSSKGHLGTTRELLRLDTDLSSLQDNQGRTPLHWAAIKGRVNIIDEIISVSLESSEMITTRSETVLHLAVKNNQFDAVKYLMENLSVPRLVNRPDIDGNTVLHLATAGKLSTMVAYLIKLKVDVNAINRKGQTALDIVESDVSNSGTLSILPAILDAAGKRGDQLPPISREIQPIEQENVPIVPFSSPKSRMSLPYESPDLVHIRSQRSHQRRGRREKHLQLQDEGLRNARKTLTVVAVLIATVTFAAGINPPGGFNQETGLTIRGRQTSFKVFVACNVVALFLSLGIVIVLVSIIPFKRKSMMSLLIVTHKVMWVSTSFMAAAYVAAMWTILPHGRGMAWVLAVVIVVGGGCTLAIFTVLGALLAKHWKRKLQMRKTSKEKKNKNKKISPSSSISRLEEMKTIRRETSHDSTSNSDFDSSEQDGYHLY